MSNITQYAWQGDSVNIQNVPQYAVDATPDKTFLYWINPLDGECYASINNPAQGCRSSIVLTQNMDIYAVWEDNLCECGFNINDTKSGDYSINGTPITNLATLRYQFVKNETMPSAACLVAKRIREELDHETLLIDVPAPVNDATINNLCGYIEQGTNNYDLYKASPLDVSDTGFIRIDLTDSVEIVIDSQSESRFCGWCDENGLYIDSDTSVAAYKYAPLNLHLMPPDVFLNTLSTAREYATIPTPTVSTPRFIYIKETLPGDEETARYYQLVRFDPNHPMDIQIECGKNYTAIFDIYPSTGSYNSTAYFFPCNQ